MPLPPRPVKGAEPAEQLALPAQRSRQHVTIHRDSPPGERPHVRRHPLLEAGGVGLPGHRDDAISLFGHGPDCTDRGGGGSVTIEPVDSLAPTPLRQLRSNGCRLQPRLDESEPVHLFKQDPRSRVWQIDSPDGAVVIKRFEYSPPRQMLAAMFGLHPAQRELRANRMLQRRRFPVVPIVATGRQWVAGGIKFWLATPMWGRSVQTLLRDPPRPRGPNISAVARLVHRLINDAVFFKDLKTSNIIIDDCGVAWLIDVGSASRETLRRRLPRMLAMLDSTAQHDGASRTDRLRCLQAIAGPAGGNQALRRLLQAVAAIALE